MSIDVETGRIRALIERLSCDDQLPISAKFLRDHPQRELSDVQKHLARLITSEPGIFLERYGSQLTVDELKPFLIYQGT
jgi:hypothetical protein